MNQSNENHLRETESVLQNCLLAREDDLLLVMKVWHDFHHDAFEKLTYAKSEEEFLAVLKQLPQMDSIKRYRRTLRKKYPSSKEAEEKRRKEQEESTHFYAANGQASFLPPSFNMQHE